MFKGNLQNANLPLDGSEWDKLFGELHPVKKRRIAWWWFGIAAILILGGTYLFVNNNNDVDPITTTSQPATPIQSESSPSSPETTDPESGNTSNSEATPSDDIATQDEPKAVDLTGFDNNATPKQNNRTSSDRKTNDAVEKTPPTPENIQEHWVYEHVDVSPKHNILWVIDWSWRSLTEKHPSFVSLTGPKDTSIKPARLLNPYVGLSVGISRINQHVKASNPLYPTYKANNEVATQLPNFGISVGADFKKFQLTSGIKYEEKGQQSNPSFTYVVYDSIPHRNTQGDTIGWAPWNHRDTTVKGRTSPRYTYIGIPIGIGKSFDIGDKIDFQLGLTGNIQYLVSAKGYTLGGDFKPMNVQRLDRFNRLNLVYGGYLGFGYDLSDRLKLQLLTHYQRDGRNMIKGDDISQKMSGLGGNISLQFKLKE